ncbi:MAG: hypothetical protein ACR2KK_17370 [Acidimicrobiales bacterium]
MSIIPQTERPAERTEASTTTPPAPATAPMPTGRRTRRPLLPAAGALMAALVLGGLGALMTDNANFAQKNIGTSLAEQRIRFKPAQALTPEEKARPCLVRYAGQPLTTGAQAECYANHFIGVHLQGVAGGKTYSEMREVQMSLRGQIAQAQAANDPAVADFQRQLGEVTAKRQTLFEGETLRGLLMTSYGFGTLGAKADQAATVAYGAAGVVLLLAPVLLLRAGRRRGPA